MKKLFYIATLSVAFMSCEKNQDGFMYKATHEYQNTNGKTERVSDYFKMPCHDSTEASNFYFQSKAYHDISTWTDTTYVEYYCTYEEWIASGKEGMKIN